MAGQRQGRGRAPRPGPEGLRSTRQLQRRVDRSASAAHGDADQVADHVEHVRKVAGVEHAGLGGDFDGTSEVTVGLEDVSQYPALFGELIQRGWTEADCEALAGGNILRVMRAAESHAVTTAS